MDLTKRLLVCLIVLVSLGSVYSETLEIHSFSDYTNFGIEKDQNLCKTYEFNALREEDGSKLVANIVIDNYIPVKNNLKISVYLNEMLAGTVADDKIKKENYIELNGTQAHKNTLQVCVENTALPKVIISNKSNVGSYLLGEVRENEDFYQTVLASERYTTKLIPIEIYAKNSGKDKLTVEIRNANEKFLENSNLETVSGQTSYSGVLEPGQEIVLRYFVKTNKDMEFATPRAELKYVDEFGVSRTIYARQEKIDVAENQNKIELYVDLKKNVIAGRPKTGKIILKNNSQDDIKNINIETRFDGKIIVSKRQVPLLKRFEVVELPFEITTDEIREYYFDATVYYNIGEKENGVHSQTIIVNSIEDKNFVTETIGVFLIITIILYVWLVRF